jgi:hypothetical protein
MRRLLLHLSIALVAFVIGVTIAMGFGVFSGTSEKQSPCAPAALHFEPMPFMPPMPPPAPLAPLPPEPLKNTRIVIRRSDGSVQVIESQTGKSAERNSKGS